MSETHTIEQQLKDWADDLAAEMAPSSTPTILPERRRTRRPVRWLGAAAIVAVVGVGSFVWISSTPSQDAELSTTPPATDDNGCADDPRSIFIPSTTIDASGPVASSYPHEECGNLIPVAGRNGETVGYVQKDDYMSPPLETDTSDLPLTERTNSSAPEVVDLDGNPVGILTTFGFVPTADVDAFYQRLEDLGTGTGRTEVNTDQGSLWIDGHRDGPDRLPFPAYTTETGTEVVGHLDVVTGSVRGRNGELLASW